jgi:predicted RNase H-like nuclease (RuvC/YqgF family)
MRENVCVKCGRLLGEDWNFTDLCPSCFRREREIGLLELEIENLSKELEDKKQRLKQLKAR